MDLSRLEKRPNVLRAPAVLKTADGMVRDETLPSPRFPTILRIHKVRRTVRSLLPRRPDAPSLYNEAGVIPFRKLTVRLRMKEAVEGGSTDSQDFRSLTFLVFDALKHSFDVATLKFLKGT